MKRLFIFLTILASSPASAVDPTIVSGAPGLPVTSAEFGLSGAPLANTPKSLPIDMEATRATNQLALTLIVRPGTTTSVTLWCEESEVTTSSSFGVTNVCSGVCTPDKRVFTLSLYPTTPQGTKVIKARFGIKQRYALCVADDPNDGTGKIESMTATRSWQ